MIKGSVIEECELNNLIHWGEGRRKKGEERRNNRDFSSPLRAARVSSGAPAVRSLREHALRAPAGSFFFLLSRFVKDMSSDSKSDASLRRIAAALGYDTDADDAPRLLAKGQGELADRIIALAKQHDIPIREDRDLVAVLAKLDLDREIPPELYRVVAELLAFVYKANNRWKDENK